MANILTIPESGIYFDGNTAGGADIPILTGNASAVAIQYDGYAGIEVNSSATGANYLDRFSVEGSNGRLFGVTDETTGVIFSVNDAAGLPVIEVESTSEYDKITIGEYATDALVISGSSVKVTGSNVVTEGYLTDGGYLTSSTETYSTASELLAALLTVDGAGSNLDADKLDSQESSYYLNYSNFTNTPTIPSAANNATITLLGGGGITTSIGDFTTNQSANETLTISHSDTSSQASVDNNNGTVIQDVFLDTYGHITGIGSTNLDSRYNNYSLPSGTSSVRGGFKIGYSENGKNYPVEVSSEQMFVNVPWTDANTTYSVGSGISLSGTTFSVAAGGGLTQTATGLSHTDTSSQASVDNNNGTVIQDVFLDTYGHITGIGSTNLDSRYNNYSLPSGTSSVRGGFKIGYSENGKNYPVEVSSEQMFVNVPWTDANTTYSVGSGISLSGTTFSVAAGGGLTQTATGLSHTDTSSQASVDNNNGTVIQDVFLDTYGHITGIGSTNLDSRYNNYSLPSGTSSVRGGFKIGYSENGKNYPVEVSSEQMFVNVPWTDANTTYSVGSGISLSGTTFSVAAGGGLTQTATGLSHTDTSSQASVDNNNGTVIQDVFLDTYGHITGIGSTNLDSRYNNYSLPAGTSSERGGFKIGYSENGKNYPVEVSSEQMFVTVPWADADTTYSAGAHLSLSGTTFNLNLGVADAVLNIGHNSISNEGEIVLDTSNVGSPQISFTEHGDASWAIGVDDTDNSFKIHGVATSVIPTINGLATPLFEIATNGLGYLGANRLFADNYHPNADTLTTARTISLAGAVTGSVSFNGSSDVSITTTATADPTLTLSGDATGSATFTNLGNATLSVSVVNDSHTHTKLSGFSHQVEYDLIRAGNFNGLCMKARWDGATTNRYWDMGHVDGNGTFTSGLKVFNNGDLTYKGNTVFHDTYHPNADTLTTARTISLAGAVTGSVSFNGSSNVSITTTATADPTLTLSGDASGSATFTNLGNATLSVTIADDSHNHIISNIDGLQVALDAKAPLANPALTGIPTAPTPSAGTSSTQIATTAFVNSYFVSNRLETPVQNFNPWGVNKFYHGVETNRFHGRSEFLSLSVDGGSASAPSIYLTEGGYENSAGVYGTVGGSDVVLLYDFETNGLTGVNGFTYASGQFHIHFYPGRHPTAITARVKDRNDSWTSMTMTGYKEYTSGNYISWRGTVPIGNYITAVEFTLTPQGTGGTTISLTELEYHGTRIGLSEGGLLTKNGGDIFGNLNVSGNVGIGTTSPDAALHVAGAIPIAPTGSGVLMGLQSNYGIVHLNGSTGGILDFSSSGVDRKGRILYDNAGNYMQIQTNGSDKVRIDSSGNVGIGTTTPSAKLEVAGSSKFLGTTHHSWFNNGSSEDTFIRGGKATSKVYINDSHSADVVIASGGGKVGIGTTAPEGKLHVWGGNAGAVVAEGEADDLIVENGSSGGVSILVPDSSNSNIRFGSPSVNSGALLRWNYNDGLMTAGTNKAGAGYRIMTGSFVEALRVASTGNVGIGTTSPMGKLHVSAGSAGTYTPTATTQFIIEDDQSTGITIANPDGSTGHLYFGSPSRQIGALISHSFGSAKMTIGTGYTGHEVSILSGNSVEAIRVNSTGSVGIGTTTPAEKLDVVGNILATSFKKSGGSSSEFLKADGSVDSNSYLTSLGTAILDGDFTVSGLMKRTGVGTYASITDNSSNWNTAYGWGNHASGGYATLANPALTGIPTAPTAAANTNTTQIATTAYVQTELSDLIGAAPAALDTLNELAAAIGDDASYASSITTALAGKLSTTGKAADSNLLDSIDSLRFPYALNGSLGSTNTFTSDGGIGADNITRSMFYRDNGSQFGQIGFHAQHATSVGYAWQMASTSYTDASSIKARVKNNGTWTSPVTIWNSGNDGAGSGLDADTLDGYQATAFQGAITAPNAPTSVTSTIVGQTIDLTFNASSTSSIDAYLVYSSVDGSDYGLIQVIPPADFSSTMSVIDTAFTHTGTQAYRVYAMKYGILSSAGTASVSYTVSSAEPSNVEVINMNNAYYVQWNPPSTNARFVTSYNVFKHEASTAGALLRASASLVYSGLNTNYMYQINGNNNNNFHQFWVETTIA
jgi:hypothetical protein